jgi:outer membrane immunogenic protein
MKRACAIICSVLGLLSGPAIAADMPIPYYKAQPLPAVPAYSWSGFYVGATAGGAWSDPGVASNVTGLFCSNGGGAFCPYQAITFAAANPAHYGPKASGFVGGADLGYNWQIGRWVAGLEADLSSSLSGSSAASGITTLQQSPLTTSSVTGSVNERLDYFGSARGRLGYSPYERLLVYGTGGLAYGHATSSTSLDGLIGGSSCFCGPPPVSTASASAILTGWTAGGGLEWMLTPHWTIRGEYLFYDLGHLNYSTPQLIYTNGAGRPAIGFGTASSAAFNGSIARVGINWKL